MLSILLLISILYAIVYNNKNSQNNSQLLIKLDKNAKVKVFANAYHHILKQKKSDLDKKNEYLIDDYNVTILIDSIDLSSKQQLTIISSVQDSVHEFRLKLNNSNVDGRIVVVSNSRDLSNLYARNVICFVNVFLFIVLLSEFILRYKR